MFISWKSLTKPEMNWLPCHHLGITLHHLASPCHHLGWIQRHRLRVFGASRTNIDSVVWSRIHLKTWLQFGFIGEGDTFTSGSLHLTGQEDRNRAVGSTVCSGGRRKVTLGFFLQSTYFLVKVLKQALFTYSFDSLDLTILLPFSSSSLVSVLGSKLLAL